MSEGLPKRMRSIVGDENTVARYLLEKEGHTSAIAWLAGCIVLGILLRAHAPEWTWRAFLIAAAIAGAATIGYDLLGKAIWLYAARQRDWTKDDAITPVRFSEELADTLFDAWVGSATIACTFGILHWWAAPLMLAVWLGGVAVGSNNQWGKPS